MASVVNFWVLPSIAVSSGNKPRCGVKVHCSGGNDSGISVSDSVSVNGIPLVGEREKDGVLVDVGNGRLSLEVEENKRVKEDDALKGLDVLWDDGFNTQSVKDYLDAAKDMVWLDGGPPRWFCPVECGQPLKDSPVLLFLPGMDGVGLGLMLHHKALGKVFEVRCLHIPINDRTPFEVLVKFVEETVMLEHASFPKKPIYLVGDSFGGCLALAVAARNPTIDLVLILVNPATSFKRSQLQPLFPVLESMPDELHGTVPYLLSFIMGNPMKMAMVDIERRLPPRRKLELLSGNLTGLLPRLSILADIIPREALLWKLKLLNSACAYANSRLHAVEAEVLVLASGKDYMLPSQDEAQRLKTSLKNCRVRLFKDNGHTLLLEDGISLLTVIKGTCKYRRARKLDYVKDFLPPSLSEFKYVFDEVVGIPRVSAGSVMLSTLEDGKIVRGLQGVPNEGPVLLVGYHMLMGLELSSLVEEFLREKKIMVRGLAHPELFQEKLETHSSEFALIDWMKVMGALPVSASNLFRLFSENSHILLYPGGAREALHAKGQEYKLIWPDQPEFVRMAARFGATIVPFGAVGEDDLVDLVLDYNDLMKIPFLNDYIKDISRDAVRVRDEELFIPGLLPKFPGRLYYLFGKPTKTKGREEELKDRGKANQLYLQIKSEVECNLAYLLKKREEDPYRSVIDRSLYHMVHTPLQEIPAFEP
ncbi:DAGAT domain-containing protein/Abhydrolase_6 domain-containing protein [Cephalotus follicularis]|uniref:DAGAT domain-containing protein/Abhydrolase_6 domain-containing protein n=1 Tax=Cephalotus follicularis TaxID=3775 RepID=A0A1Q3B8W6_CEPFO|nr:DAGAT domain-containing protein/Abhydrolase_6 domain-containing protein [Cephalotus follicularis]